MFISLPKEFLLNSYINKYEKKTLHCESLEEFTNRDFQEITNLFLKKFNFLFLKSLNILKKFSLKELYDNSSFIFSGIFYSHEIIILSLKPEKSNKEPINLCKMLLEYMDSKDNSSAKKYKKSINTNKSKSTKNKKERIKTSTINLNKDLEKSIDQIKFEYRSLLLEILEQSKNLDSRDINSFYNKFIEDVIITDIKYICDFMNLEYNNFEEKIRTFTK